MRVSRRKGLVCKVDLVKAHDNANWDSLTLYWREIMGISGENGSMGAPHPLSSRSP